MVANAVCSTLYSILQQAQAGGRIGLCIVLLPYFTNKPSSIY
jgi:hypothetical protein